MDLTEEQQAALDAVIDGKSLVLSGPAGSGKTRWIQTIKTLCPHAVVTAMTGLAAVSIGGITLHKLAGIGIAEPGPKALPTDAPEEFVAKAAQHIGMKIRPDVRKAIQQLELLVVEECSMLSEYLADVLDLLFRKIRRRPTAPWGGVQLVLVGDMRQLAPVAKARDHPMMGRFFFESAHFERTFGGGVHVLTRIFRQRSGEMQALLNRVAVGKPTTEDIARLRSRIIRPPVVVPTETAIRLVGKRDAAACFNDAKLGSIDAPSRSYQMTVKRSDGATESLAAWAVKNCIIDERVTVKEGALVMLVWNIAPGFANGTVGYVVGYTPAGYPLFQPKESFGQDGVKHEHNVLAVTPVEWSVVDHSFGKVTMEQVPLKLAYAITIHKAQGIQVDEAVLTVDRFNCFADGQAYVAFSRLTTLEGMYLTGFDPAAIKANPAAIAFYERYARGKVCEAAGAEVSEADAGDIRTWVRVVPCSAVSPI